MLSAVIASVVDNNKQENETENSWTNESYFGVKDEL
jgi:hypothetical protein